MESVTQARQICQQIDVAEVLQLHADTVANWHEQPVENSYNGFLSTVCEQHTFNFKLWHEEDMARCPDSDDSKIAAVKRAIDGYNQNRNDWIERIDDEITKLVQSQDIVPEEDAKLNTETPGSVIDRLSILALRIYHLNEQLERDDISAEHTESVQRKIAICNLQKDDLSQSLTELLNDIFSGRKRHRTYRQFKMYNDPALNPYLYQAQQKTA